MTVSRSIDGKVIYGCDSCGATFEADSNSFAAAWLAAETQGWTTRAAGDEWFHSCPRCGGSR